METPKAGTIFWTALKLVIVSVIVGYLMHFFGVEPQDVFDFLAEAIQGSFRVAFESLHGVFQYLLIGAAVVIPIWLVFLLVKIAGRKS